MVGGGRRCGHVSDVCAFAWGGAGPPGGLGGRGCLLVNQSEHGDGVMVCVLVALVPQNLALESLHNLQSALLGQHAGPGR